MSDFFWKQHTASEFALPKLNEKSLKMTEEKLGIQLPQSFISINLIQNGGEITFNNYQLKNLESDLFINEIFGIDPNLGIGLSPILQKQWAVPENLIIISGDEEDWFALDYSKSSAMEPRVVWYDVSYNKIRTIAKTFEDFIQILIDPPFDYTAEDFD